MKHIRNFIDKVMKLYSRAINSNKFLIVFAIIIGIIAWTYIIYAVNPEKTKEFNKVPIRIDIAGSVPERNGLALLKGDLSKTMDIVVQGPRANLLKFNEEDLNIYLNFEDASSPGRYYLPVVMTSRDPEIKIITEPITILFEFDTKVTKEFPVTMAYTGTLPEGYVVANEEINPATVEITGPAEVVNSIYSLTLPENIEGRKAGITGSQDIAFKTSDNQNIDKTYLTISKEYASYNLDIKYRKTLHLSSNLINNNGGDESGYITATYDPLEVTVEGTEEALKDITEIRLEDIALDKMEGNEQIYYLNLPESDLFRYVGDSSVITVTTQFRYDKTNPVSVTNFTLNKTLIDRYFTITGIPEGKTARITTSSVTIPIRSVKTVRDAISVSNGDITGVIDISESAVINDQGQYLVRISLGGNVSFGLMKAIYVTVEISE